MQIVHALFDSRRMRKLTRMVLAASLVMPAWSARAEYPERPLRAIVPFTPGGPNDILARAISPLLARALGQNVIVENRPGADGRIGIDAMAKAAPDAHTILFSGDAVAVVPALRRNVPYDPVRDIQPVAELGSSPYVIVVHPQVPAHNLKQLIDVAKKNPGGLNGSSGGNTTFMALVMFQIMTGTKIVNIPYKGSGDAGLAVVRGEADMAIIDLLAFANHVESGRIRMLAVAGDKRARALPDVPTTREAGLPDYAAGSLFGVFTTGRSPIDSVRRLNAEINKIVATPEIATRLVALGMEPSHKTVEEFSTRYTAQLAKWKNVVARAKIPLEN